MLTDKEDAQADTEDCEADSRTSLERLISLLQGGCTAALADAGLTGLSVEQLSSIHRHASYQAEQCYDQASLLLRLMCCCVQHRENLQPNELAAGAAQIATLVQERQRWMTLAENAQYYQQHRDAAEKIARGLLRYAHMGFA
jgi:cell division protein FtsB